MTGKRYRVVMAPAAHRRFKKFAPTLQEKVKEEATKLAEDPYQHEELKGVLKGLRSYKFSFKGTAYRIAYRTKEREKRIEIVLVRPRQNFYQLLRHIMRR
jgi:mRNA-degrading endonuclease RelE of RelBE toxin-antitoxin system